MKRLHQVVGLGLMAAAILAGTAQAFAADSPQLTDYRFITLQTDTLGEFMPAALAGGSVAHAYWNAGNDLTSHSAFAALKGPGEVVVSDMATLADWSVGKGGVSQYGEFPASQKIGPGEVVISSWMAPEGAAEGRNLNAKYQVLPWPADISTPAESLLGTTLTISVPALRGATDDVGN